MKESLLITVVMPVYNSVDYLHDAVSSILAEKSNQFELVLIDDGSTDGSGELCDGFEQIDSRVRVIHKDNGGICDARNLGIANANGQYIMFSDNDDRVLPGFIDYIIEILSSQQVDVIRFGRKLNSIDPNGNIFRSVDAVPGGWCLIHDDDMRRHLPELYFGSDGVWNGTYKKKLLLENHIEFPVRFKSGLEDVWFNDSVYSVAQSILLVPETFYIWMRRINHSTSMKPSENRLSCQQELLAFEFLMMTESNLRISHPTWCAGRIFSLVKGRLVEDGFSKRDRTTWVSKLDRLRTMLEPYAVALGAPPSKQDAAMFHLLMGGHYSLLWAFIYIGVRFKRCLGR